MRNKKLFDWWSNQGYPDETPDGKQVIVIIGDSKTGTSPSAGPTPSAGTVYEWDASGGAIVEVGSDDLTGTTVGSPWPRCGVNYNAGTGKKPVFVYNGSSGSTYSTHGTGNSWNTSGNLYAPMKVKVDAALTALGLTKPKAIFVILGVNDANGAVALSTIQSDVQSLFNRLTTDFGGCDIVALIPSSSQATVNSQRLISVRTYINDESFARTNVHCLFGETAFREITGLYTDNLHYNATGNDWIGVFYGYWLLNSSYSKFGRSFFSSMFTDITSHRKALLDTCLAAEFANGNLAKYEWFIWFKNADAKDVWIDFAGHYAIDMTAFTFTANSHITSSGTARINTGFVAGLNFSKVTQNDIFIGAKIRTRVSSATANATVFGVSDADTDAVIVAQTSTPSLIYSVNDQTSTASTSPDASIQNDTFYAAIRSDANNKSLIKNAAVINTAAVASTGEPSAVNREQYLAVKNQNGSIVNALAAEWEWWVCAKGDIDYAAHYNNWEAVSNGW